MIKKTKTNRLETECSTPEEEKKKKKRRRKKLPAAKSLNLNRLHPALPLLLLIVFPPAVRRIKRRKQFRGRLTGKATRGNKIAYGEYEGD